MNNELKRLTVNESELIHNPLWYHKRGLMQTATGYGRKIATEKMIKHNGRLKRIYCCIYSNSGSLYIMDKKEWIFIDIN